MLFDFKVYQFIVDKTFLLILKVSHLFDIVTEEHEVHAAEAQLGYVEEQIYYTPESQKTETKQYVQIQVKLFLVIFQ